MKRAIEERVGWVHSAVVLWAEFPARVVEGDRVTFLHGEELATWLGGSGRPTLEPEKVRAIAQAIATLA